MNLLLSSYSFGAGRGSEAGVGWNIAKGLASRGHQVTVITTSEFSKINRSTIAEENLSINLIEEDCGISDFPRSQSYQKWQRRICSTILKIASIGSYDLIHHLTLNQYRWAHDVFSTNLPYILGPVGGAELVPSPLLRYGHLPLIMQIKEMMRRCTLDVIPLIRRCKRHRKSGIVLASNQATADRLKKLPVRPIICPAIAVHRHEIISSPAPVAAQASFILFDGSLTRSQKGVRLALRTICQLWKKGIQLPLRIVGLSPDDTSVIHLYARKINLPGEALQLEGYVTRSTMLQYMQQAIVMLSCVYRDSGSMALLEALAQGCRIVCLDIPSQEWLPEHFCHKVAVQPTSSAMEEALVSALQQEITAPANTEEWHKSRVQWIEQNMTWDARLDTFEEMYRQILSKKPSA